MDVNWLNANYLPWLILFFPLLSAAIIMLVANRSVIASQAVSVGGIGLSWVLSLLLFVKTVWSTDKALGEDIFGSQLDWLDIGAHTFRVGVMVDPLTAYMLLMVPLACLMIFIYSVGYMRGDPKNARFFGYLALFAGAMLTLTVADNFLLLFIGWEVMGFCSYSLIGFWAHKKSAMEAGVKAFMTTRVADVLMLVGIGYLFVLTTTIDGVPNPTLNFRELMYNALPAETAVEPEAEAAAPAAEDQSIPAEGEGLTSGEEQAAASSGEVEGGEGVAEAEHVAGPTIVDRLTEIDSPLFGMNAAVLIGVLLVIGTVGKSAQFPLHTWLPDAMEGPTPVSAMIHAAAMVSAGVYMLVRVFPLLSAGANFHEFDYNTTMYLMGLVGAITALGASVLAVGQDDIKRILAYSTVSQLGYMVAALGIGAWVAAAFHLINHAFFKALLFMASGSVIHAMEHGEHHAHEGGDAPHHEEPDGLIMDYCAPPNNIQRMGGLLHRIPVTAITMALGGLSLAGFPLVTAGFWSKDEIISEAWHGAASDPFPLLILLMLLLGAALTAFYTARMWFMTFWGTPRTDAAAHSGLGSLRKQWVVFWNRRGLSEDYKLTQEPITARDRLSANQMELPLVILAFLAVTAGFIGIHKSLVGRNPLHDFLAGTLLEHPEVIGFNVLPMLVSMILALGGLTLGWYIYGRRPVKEGEADPVQVALGPQLWTLLQNRLYIDLFYRRYLLRPFESFVSEERWALPGEEKKPEDERVMVSGINYVDRGIIDDLLHSIAAGFVWLGEAVKRFNTVVIDGFIDGVVYSLGDFAKWFRQAQTGRVQQYLLFVTLALLAIGTLLIIQVR
jgi:NADH:ubiquinone oxidoreductase subunit 5 (subunit L)/multisubunit Na+/H+ antiporter MnhA subunit